MKQIAPDKYEYIRQSLKFDLRRKKEKNWD
jgi:hypothetical protein